MYLPVASWCMASITLYGHKTRKVEEENPACTVHRGQVTTITDNHKRLEQELLHQVTRASE